MLSLLLIWLPRTNSDVKTIGGIVDKRHIEAAGSAAAAEECLYRNCGNRSNCAISYKQSTRSCYKVSLTSQVLLWIKDELRNKAEYTTLLNLPTSTVNRRPVLLYIFDDISKGLNFGSQGMNGNVNTSKIAWSRNGPRKGSSRKYGVCDLSSPSVYRQAMTNVSLQFNGKKYLEFRKIFTMSAWIYVSHIGRQPYLFTGLDTHGQAISFSVSIGILRDNLLITDSNCYQTSIGDSSMQLLRKWFHVAVAFQNYCTLKYYQFFFNGQPLITSEIDRRRNEKQGCNDVSFVPVINFWILPGHYNFPGSIACLMFHDKILFQDEIRALKQNCP